MHNCLKDISSNAQLTKVVNMALDDDLNLPLW